METLPVRVSEDQVVVLVEQTGKMVQTIMVAPAPMDMEAQPMSLLQAMMSPVCLVEQAGREVGQTVVCILALVEP